MFTAITEGPRSHFLPCVVVRAICNRLWVMSNRKNFGKRLHKKTYLGFSSLYTTWGPYLGIYVAHASVNIVLIEGVNGGKCGGRHSIYVNNPMNKK